MMISNGATKKPPVTGWIIETAREVFKDVFAIEWTDNGHTDPEERFVTVGMVEPPVVRFLHPARGENPDHLGARSRTPGTTRYHEQNQA